MVQEATPGHCRERPVVGPRQVRCQRFESTYADVVDGSPAPGLDYPQESGETTLARLERERLCDLLDSVGPAAPTLDEGWTTHHLAAHLVLRDSGVRGMLQAVRPSNGDSKVDQMVATEGFDSLVATLRLGPPRRSPFALPYADRLLNRLEFLVHHEDVRRAAADWQPRTLPRWVHDQVWGQLGWFARTSLRGSPAGVVLHRTDTGDRSFVVKKIDPVELAGDPVELTLYVFGRRAVAKVEVRTPTGDSAHFTQWLTSR